MSCVFAIFGEDIRILIIKSKKNFGFVQVL